MSAESWHAAGPPVDSAAAVAAAPRSPVGPPSAGNEPPEPAGNEPPEPAGNEPPSLTGNERPPEPPPLPGDLPPEPAAVRAGPHGLGGRRLALSALLLTLVSALAGGLIGGYVSARNAGNGPEPGFSLGTVPPGLTNRAPALVAGIAARVLPSVVMIKVAGGQGTGSGFIIGGGYVVTDNHVVTLDGRVPHASLQVVFNNGHAVPARVVGADPFSDIAVIRPRVTGRLPALSLGNSAGVDVGDPVVAFGSPLGLAGTVTSGIVSALHRPVHPGGAQGTAAEAFINAIQTDAPINPGNSGGPLVNGQAQVIGVNAAIATIGSNPLTGQSGSIGLGFAIPANQVRLIAMELIRTGKATHAVLGVLLDSGYTGQGARILGAARHGVPPVTPRGPAAQAGLRPGDVIIRFGGTPIASVAALIDAIRSRQPGTRVTVVFLRTGQRHVVSLMLGSAPS